LRDIRRKIEGCYDLHEVFESELNKAERLLNQGRDSKNKLYSLHESATECISKGKAGKKYEFGCKASFVITHGKGRGFVLVGEALHGNPYDGHTLSSALASSQKMTGVKAKKVFVDAGYRGHGIEDKELTIWHSRQKRGITGWIKKQINRRQAIEPYFGHMKNECKLGRCRLWGIKGDQAHAVMVAAGYNLKLILKHIRQLCAPIVQMFYIRLTISLA
jgi:IS5 family transposase